MTKIPDIVEWAESEAGYYLAETKRPIILAPHQKDILRHVFTPEAGKLPYETILLSSPKKSGKTTIEGMALLYMGLFIEPGSELFSLANTYEQSTSRAFKDLKKSIQLNPVLKKRTTMTRDEIRLDNGSVIKALSSDYAGAAGSRHSCVGFDELWAYSTESGRRLYDELTPVPTLRNSIRLIVTYAGFEGESDLLERIFKQGQEGDPVPELLHIDNGRGQPACRENGRTFSYWDHQLKPHAGLTVSPAEYHEQQRKDLRPGAFARLHLNEWVSSISAFVTKEQWQACYSPDVKAFIVGDDRKMILGADASTSRDLTALVGTWRAPDGSCHIVYCKTWKPQKNALRAGKLTIDLSETIGAEIVRLASLGVVSAVVYDPFQLHSIALDLGKEGINMIEMPQTNARVASDQALYDAIIGRRLMHYNDPQLTEHIMNSVAIEGPRGYRLAKEKTSRKIDAAVALSMSHYHTGITPAPSHLTDQPIQPSRWDIGKDAGSRRVRGGLGRWVRHDA